MKYKSEEHHRRSIRLVGYDYSQPGAYFVTICTFQKKCVFSEIVDGQRRLNDWGRIVHEEWFRSARVRPEIELDACVVMPNHMHAIVGMTVGADSVRPQAEAAKGTRRVPLRRSRSLSSLVAGFKSSTTSRIRQLARVADIRVWQRNFYEHIIRDENELNKAREYISTNPLRWPSDPENPASTHEIEADFPWEMS